MDIRAAGFRALEGRWGNRARAKVQRAVGVHQHLRHDGCIGQNRWVDLLLVPLALRDNRVPGNEERRQDEEHRTAGDQAHYESLLTTE